MISIAQIKKTVKMMKVILFMVIWKVCFYAIQATNEDPVLQVDEKALTAYKFEIHGDELVRNEEDMPGNVQFTVVHKSKLEDLLIADMSVDELHNCKDVLAISNMVRRYQIHNPLLDM